LTALADLVKPGLRGAQDEEGDDLDDEERQILMDAGIISAGPSGSTKARPSPKHIVFVETEEEGESFPFIDISFPAEYSLARKYKRARISGPGDAEIDKPTPMKAPDLGWKVVDAQKKSKKLTSTSEDAPDETLDDIENLGDLNRRRLLKELSARLARDTQLRYAEREFEMQRLMMGKGGRRKLKDAERMEGDDEEDADDEDEIDARKGKRTALVQKVDEKTYKPRVYKWRLERKR
jgi:U3 small nucleolar RNA-associated protein 11